MYLLISRIKCRMLWSVCQIPSRLCSVPSHFASTAICHANLFSITCYQRFASDYANVSNVRLTPTHAHPQSHANWGGGRGILLPYKWLITLSGCRCRCRINAKTLHIFMQTNLFFSSLGIKKYELENLFSHSLIVYRSSYWFHIFLSVGRPLFSHFTHSYSLHRLYKAFA